MLLDELLSLFSLVSLNHVLVGLVVPVALLSRDDVDPLLGVLVDWFNVDSGLVVDPGSLSVIGVDNRSVDVL